MSNTSSVGGEPSPVSARQPHQSQKTTEETATTGVTPRSRRKVQAVNAQPQKGLRARVKNFLPVSIYKFIVKFTLPSQSQQKTLALNIQKAREANSKAWDQLGKESHHSSSQQLKGLQLACEKSQHRLDLLEGRKDSPVTAQRAVVIALLEKACRASDEELPDFEKAYLVANDTLKQVQQHEIQLEADLNAAKRKLKSTGPVLEARIERADQILTRESLERSGLYDVSELSESEQEAESLILQKGQKAREELKDLKKTVASLNEEFHQFQKNLIDEELAREAYLRYGDSAHHKPKGKGHE